MKDQALTLALQVLETYINAITLLESTKSKKSQHEAHSILFKNMKMAIMSASVIREVLAIKTDDVTEAQTSSVELSDPEVELMAVKHEDFGFGLVDNHGISTHGFSPEGLKAFVQEILYKAQTKDLCWCDLNKLGEPGVSCGDCPTRDYKRINGNTHDSGTLPKFEHWVDSVFGSEFKNTETLTYFRMSAAWDNAQQQLAIQFYELRKSLNISREYGKKTLELALMWRRRWKELEEEIAILKEGEPIGHIDTIAGK
jgi:hypothetical protein